VIPCRCAQRYDSFEPKNRAAQRALVSMIRSNYAMKKLLFGALMLSLAGNLYFAFRLQSESNTIDEGLHAEVICQSGLRDLSYFLRKSAPTGSQLLGWAKSQPSEAGIERLDPELVGNRFVRFPLEITFGPSGAVDRVLVGGEKY